MKQIFMLPPPLGADSHTVMMYRIINLPEAQRDVLLLFYHERLSLTEIAQVLERTGDEVAELFYLAQANLGRVSEVATLEERTELVGAL